ncbi:ParA family protein [Candidatus Magnetominusculus xianensis]|uniref:Sporulation initiation inhibitor protein Soj n=1 Tax=Candidatus Magnetominusculus xianensis TaxID=1748249 RepID=A0ABR5SEE1_9BACT|nr:ParA family protein [Candidatus Magnetominusculus xianensis]KWT82473.1 sporulation initiation inhibitor protein Soj [Candidatus Magnetominusculus xianensis]MBF0403193.1 ParA family protein [Nitrospirota bacterium]
MVTVCLANHKGGTGKTSICINMGTYFAKKKVRTLIIDMDPQGHVAPGLGIDIAYNDRSIADVLANQEEIAAIVANSSIKGLDVAPSNIRLSLVNETLYNTFKRERRLMKAMEKVYNDKTYDLVIIDCPPSLGPLVENSLMVTDYCLIPCEPSSRSIDGLADFIIKLKDVRDGELDDRWHIILSRVKKSARLTNEVIDNKLSEYKNRIFKTKIYERETINQAQIAGIPVFGFPRGQLASENFSKFGKEVASRCQIK